MSFAYKPFSEKQLSVIDDQDNPFITILDGAVSSGKTIASIIKWLMFVENSPHTENFIMSGFSVDSLYKNVISVIEAMLGEKRAIYKSNGKGGASLTLIFGKGKKKKIKRCICVGAGKEDSEKRIRGLSSPGWYGDEITLHHESFVKQALNRLRMDGASAIWTTNPDSPFHYIKTDYIDKADENGYKLYHFDMDDNLTLSDRYKENIKKAYTGLFYDRFIKGLWVLASGIIYGAFNKDKHIVKDKDLPESFDNLYISSDYGCNNTQVFLLIGTKVIDKKNHVYALKEWYDNSEGRTDNRILSDYKKFVSDFPIKNVIIDPSALSLINLFKANGVKVKEADNKVILGIQNVCTHLEQNLLHIHESCKNLIKEFGTYVWDEKAQKQGVDAPVKKHDHALDALRYFIQTLFPVRDRTVRAGPAL